MATILSPARTTASFQCLRLVAHTSPTTFTRFLSTLPSNPHIYIHPPSPTSHPKSYTLSLLPTSPPTPSLAIGTSTTNPPTPDSVTENPVFMDLVHEILAKHAAQDPDVQAQAAMYASQAGSALGSGGMFFPQAQRQKRRRSSSEKTQTSGGGGGTGGDGAGGASSQGGMGGGSRSGYIHVSDQRAPPDFGRVAWPEDIFGSLEVDGKGGFVDESGRYQRSGTYRVVTREGVLGLSGFLRGKVREALEGLERAGRRNG